MFSAAARIALRSNVAPVARFNFSRGLAGGTVRRKYVIFLNCGASATVMLI